MLDLNYVDKQPTTDILIEINSVDGQQFKLSDLNNDYDLIFTIDLRFYYAYQGNDTIGDSNSYIFRPLSEEPSLRYVELSDY